MTPKEQFIEAANIMCGFTREDFANLAGLFRSGVAVDLIPEQWDRLVRVAASLKNPVCPAHVVVQRLANSSPLDRLVKALTMLRFGCKDRISIDPPASPVGPLWKLRHETSPTRDAETLSYRHDDMFEVGEIRHSIKIAHNFVGVRQDVVRQQ